VSGRGWGWPRCVIAVIQAAERREFCLAVGHQQAVEDACPRGFEVRQWPHPCFCVGTRPEVSLGSQSHSAQSCTLLGPSAGARRPPKLGTFVMDAMLIYNRVRVVLPLAT